MAVAVATSSVTAANVLAGSASITANKPASTAVGDKLIAFCWYVSTGSPTVLPTTQNGFTKIRSRIDFDAVNSLYYQIGAYQKTADGSEASTLTFTETAAGPIGGSLSICRVTGAAATGFINDSNDSFTASGTSPTAASVSPTVPGTLELIYAQGASNTVNGGTDWAAAAPSGFTLASGSINNDASNQWYMGAASKALAAAGATGTVTFPFSGGVNTVFQAISLAIAPPGANPFRRDLSYYLEQ